MEIIRDIDSVNRDADSVLTVGTFDGLHLGHQFIIRELKKRANSRGAKSTLVTFQPHPQLVLKASDKPGLKILTTSDEKIEILKALETIDRLVIIEFTYDFSKTKPETFVKDILFESIGFSEIAIGYDHAFGKNRQGDIETLKEIGSKLGFSVDGLAAVKVDGILVSSTKIRKLLLECNIRTANKLLGRNYFLDGKVVKGEGRGKDLKFPTANIQPNSPNKLVPGDGVYAVYGHLGSKRLSGMLNIGVRPTFSPSSRTIEVNFFDFYEDIYGENLRIEFIERIRNEKRFSGPDDLIAQLKEDQEKSLSILRKD